MRATLCPKLLTPLLYLGAFCEASTGGLAQAGEPDRTIRLPDVKPGERNSLTDLLHRRRSLRSFAGGRVSLKQLAHVVFAAQGITRKNRYRTVPSAGALYPLEITLFVGATKGLGPGVYRYEPKGHSLTRIDSADQREQLAQAALGQTWIADAQFVIVISAVYGRVTGKYGSRGERYAHIEAGCAAQSASLAGYSVGLGSTVVGAFRDRDVAKLIQARKGETPLVVMPVGRTGGGG
jgi:SagB-type dehydrogenase family enzyme